MKQKPVKGFLCLFLTLILAFGLFPTGAYAEVADEFLGIPVQGIAFTPYVEINDRDSYLTAMNSVFNYVSGQLESSTDKLLYGVDIDFTQSEKVVVDVNQTYLGGLKIKIYDSQENVIATKSIGPRTDALSTGTYKNDGQIILDSSTLQSGTYYIEITSEDYYRAVGTSSATTFRLLVGDERNYDYYRYGRVNATHIAKYNDTFLHSSVDGTSNFARSIPTTRMVEEYYKFTAEADTTIVLRTDASWLQFRIEDPETNEVLIDTNGNQDVVVSDFAGDYPMDYIYKVSAAEGDIALIYGKTYDLAVYSTNANVYGTYSQRDIGNIYYLSVGEPMMCVASSPILLTGSTISNTAGAYSSYSTRTLNNAALPQSAIVDRIVLSDTATGVKSYTMREVFNTADNTKYTTPLINRTIQIECNPTAAKSTPVNGTWKFRYKASKAYTITPTITLYYIYELGD